MIEEIPTSIQKVKFIIYLILKPNWKKTKEQADITWRYSKLRVSELTFKH
jgi:hypothetical protein